MPPVAERTYPGGQREIQADLSRLSRRTQPPPEHIPFVRVSPEPEEVWPVGTCWLDTLTVGPLRSHPLKVKRMTSSGVTWWDQVAWMVPE